MIKLLRCGAFLFWLVCSGNAAYASPILQVDVNGKLTGATGVDVGGTLYNMECVDGTCAQVFGTCAVSSFAFSNQANALAASQALLDQVLLDVAAGQFDSNPTLTVGCNDAFLCSTLTPYDIFSGTQFVARSAANFSPAAFPNFQDNALTTVSGSFGFDLSNEASAVWARWSSVPQAVSEPATSAILGMGLLLLISARRRRR